MPQTLLDEQNFLSILKDKDKVLFIFDYDGTLTPLVDDHNSAILSDAEVDLLHQLNHQAQTQVAIVTGRAMRNLKSLLQDRLEPEILLYGSHGAEMNQEIEHSPHSQELKAIQNKFANNPYLHIEEKPLSITIHYKKHPNREELIEELKAEYSKYQELFRIQTGQDFFEYLPKDINKGMAIQDLNNKLPDYFPIYFGDDLTDNYGFRQINRLNGLSIQVSERIKEPEAGYLIYKIADVYDLIKSYLQEK